MREYRTSDIADMVGIHPNTVRMYESEGFITAPARRPNGYRVFTDEHALQVHLVRMALQVEIVQGGLRKEALGIIHAAAQRDYDEALRLNGLRIEHIRRERDAAEEAVRIVTDLLAKTDAAGDGRELTRKQAAERLGTTVDALRTWEMNGLMTVKRRKNGYRVYDADDLRRLAVIRALRCANYSLASILRLLNTLESDPDADVADTLDTAEPDEDILSACDELVSSLDAAERNAYQMSELLMRLRKISSG